MASKGFSPSNIQTVRRYQSIFKKRQHSSKKVEFNNFKVYNFLFNNMICSSPYFWFLEFQLQHFHCGQNNLPPCLLHTQTKSSPAVFPSLLPVQGADVKLVCLLGQVDSSELFSFTFSADMKRHMGISVETLQILFTAKL